MGIEGYKAAEWKHTLAYYVHVLPLTKRPPSFALTHLRICVQLFVAAPERKRTWTTMFVVGLVWTNI